MPKTRSAPLAEAKWTKDARDAYYAEHPENFAGPGKSYPIKDASDVGDAWDLAGHAADPESVRAKIKSIAKRLGFTSSLPDTAKETTSTESTGFVSSSSAFRPLSKIATLRTCWLEDGAISLNGRQYPREAVDRLIQSAQLQLSDKEATPLTCYISHDAADQDDSLKLVGKITAVWREGVKAMASIDIANTQAGRDAATLSASGYLCTQSLRASNAEISREKGSQWPQVGGASLKLDGIDFTATPGLSIARIQDVALAENANAEGPRTIHEVFDAREQQLVEQQEKHMELDEADQGGNRATAPSASGNTAGMTSDPTDDAYHQRNYQQAPMTNGAMQGMDHEGGNLREAHDRIAMVQNRECAPSRESARYRDIYATLSESEQRALREAGRPLSSKNDAHLDAAHHAIARHLGMECESKNNKIRPASDGMQDGDDDDRQSYRKAPAIKEKAPMSTEEAARILAAAGYQVQKPKSEAEKLAEAMEAMKAEQAKQIAEMRAEQTKAIEEMKAALVGAQPTPSRKSLVEGATVPVSNSKKADPYRPGQYLREKINGLNWAELADRTAPLPEGLDLTLLINEFTNLRVIQHLDRYGWPEGAASGDRH